ncbi:SWIM zinc finger family protein [Streptomyces chrestomyceticus]|uniref:SWIM zinc finger family protein n=1 Tax=Streptomyces chrestomyceticus TaxID=68185 RepID=A0ABU7WPH6_9ACTN
MSTRKNATTDFGEADLRSLAGPRSFERGTGYLDAVTGLEVGDGWITATVHGTAAYGVHLTFGGSEGLTGTCTCPHGQEGNFCKHLVAVGLSVLGRPEGLPRQRARAREQARHLDAWLADRSRDELLALVREQMRQDRGFRRRVRLRAAVARNDLGEIRTQVSALLDSGPFARYGCLEGEAAHSYTEQAAPAVAALAELTARGRAADAVALSREALDELGRRYGETDDCDGALSSVLTRLAEVHLDACSAAFPDPAETARWLVGHLLGDLVHATGIALRDYRHVLGPEGLAVTRELAAEAHERNPSGWEEKDLLRTLNTREGAVDALIARQASDPRPSGSTHLRIARELDLAGRPAEALRWAERGVTEAPGPTVVDSDLLDYLSTRYERSGHLAQAVFLRRGHFTAHPSLAAYRALRVAAQTAGTWPAERENALKVLRTAAARDEADPHDGPVLIDVLLDEDDLDTAWQAATESGAADHQWLILADRIRNTRPTDALPVYQRLFEPLKKSTGDAAYEQLTSLLLSIRACHRLLGTDENFTAYATTLRTELKRKRKLMAMWDEHGV